MPTARLSRRAVLRAGALGGVLAVTAGCTRGSVADPPAYRLSAGTIKGGRWGGADAPWRVAVPTTTKPSGLLVCLHGKGGRAESSFEMGFADAATAHGLAFASVSGGDGYWHGRRDGSDAGALVLDALIPLARKESGLTSASRTAFIGWSMGGYGSLLLAGQVPRQQLIGVATMSAALWTTPGATAVGAFDDAEDYHAHDVFDAAHRLAGVPVSMACGTSDPFVSANRAYAAARPGTRTTFDKGGHDGDYWRSHVGPLVAWLASRA